MERDKMIPEFNETIFIFPFSFDGGLKKWEKHFGKQQLGNYWSRGKDIHSKFFLRHVLNRENKPIHYEYIENSMRWNYSDTITVKNALTDSGETETYDIQLVGLSLFVFPTGVGFVVMRIAYADNEDMRGIANLSASFSRIFANERDLVTAKVQCTVAGDKLSLRHLLQDSVGNADGNGITFFPCTNSQRAFVFQRLSAENIPEPVQYALRRNLWVSEKGSCTDMTELEETLVLNDERTCLLSPMVMCVISHDKKGTEEERRRRENNVRFSYFNLFLLCLHEQQALLLYNQKKVLIGKKISHAKQLKRDMLRFLPSYSFKLVSMEIVYQQLYLSLQKILHLEALEESFQDSITMLDSAYTQRRDTILNIALAVLSCLGLISLIADLLTILSFL